MPEISDDTHTRGNGQTMGSIVPSARTASLRGAVMTALHDAGFRTSQYSNLAEPLLTTGQVAAVLRINDRTVRSWADAGKLDAIRTFGGRRLFPLSTVVAAMDQMIASTPKGDVEA